MSKIEPRLIVSDAPRAIEFYQRAFGAEERERYTDPESGKVVHAALAIGGAVFTLAEEAPHWHNHSPRSLGGSPVILTLQVADALAVGAAMEAAGAEVIFPIQDQFYGRREGRLADPFGHLWIISQTPPR